MVWCNIHAHGLVLHPCRSHPEEVRQFYKLVDEFHRMWDVVTEFDSLSNLATQMVPVSGERRGLGLGLKPEPRPYSFRSVLVGWTAALVVAW